MKKSCCCTGHRPQGFPFEYGKDKKRHKVYLKTLEEKIKLAITEYGITNFISGMAVGVDLDFAEIVLKLRDKYAITLECAIPCQNQTMKWNDTDKLRYENILTRANEVTLISIHYTPECMLQRNRYMVDKSCLVIAVFNGIEKGGTWYTVNYANKENKIIELIKLDKIEKIIKENKKLIRNIIIAISVFVAICLIQFICIYAIKGDETWEFYKEFWNWYKQLIKI